MTLKVGKEFKSDFQDAKLNFFWAMLRLHNTWRGGVNFTENVKQANM